ncbi:hypothetical protein EON80_28670 [bacterium]|nr:MAG: hypothetical protein EON80_28670 [bacterium]
MSLDGKWFASYDPSKERATFGFDQAKVNQDMQIGIQATNESAGAMNLNGRKSIKSGMATPFDPGSSAFAFSPDGQTFVVQRSDQKSSQLEFYETTTWKLTQSWPNLNGWGRVSGVHWSRNGHFLLSTWSVDVPGEAVAHMRLTLWRVRDKKRLASTLALNNQQGFARFEVQDDGSILNLWSNHSVCLSTPTSLSLKARRVLVLPKETITAAPISPGGAYLVAGTQSGRIYCQRLK